jgi:hypothetical protein
MPPFADSISRLLKLLFLIALASWIWVILFSLEEFANFILRYLSRDGALNRSETTYFFAISLLFVPFGIFVSQHCSYLLNFKQSNWLEKSEVLFVIFLIGFHFLSYLIHRLRKLYAEDAPLENMTALFAVGAGLLLFYSIRRIKTLQSRVVLLLIGVAFLLFGFEEISWGQRIFGYETPPGLAEINYQGEFNIHNLANPLLDYFYPLLNATVAAYFLLSHKATHLIPIELHKLFLPRNAKFLGFVFAVLVPQSIAADGELTEEIVSVLMLFGSVRLLCHQFNPTPLLKGGEHKLSPTGKEVSSLSDG